MDKIIVKGARSHNLKNIDLELPKNKFIVFTGLSGSGKSSVAFDTIYAEGQRKYVESLSAYARQFLGVMEKADVDSIEGLSPAIAIDQKTSGHNPRSTVGTITEIYDYLRLLFARAGHPHSPKTGKRLQSQTVQQIVDTILNFPKKYQAKELKFMILSPVVKQRKGTYEELFQRFLTQGYIRARVDNRIYSLEEEIKLDKFKKHDIEIIIDRLVVTKESSKQPEYVKRLTDSVETALNLGNKEIYLYLSDLEQDIFFSEKLVDPETGESFAQIEPHTFSFNSPHGACLRCHGLGNIYEIDQSSVYNPNLSISEGGLFPWSRMADNMNSWHMQLINRVAEAAGFSIRTPLGKLPANNLNIVLYGAPQLRYEGLIPNLTRRYRETESDYIRREIEQYMKELPCPECRGKRLKPEALAVTIEHKNIHELGNMPLKNLKEWLQDLKASMPEKATIENDQLTSQEKEIVKQVIKEIQVRLEFLLAVGLEYLNLNRNARTLSGGESQRIRLASQIGTGLSGVLYVLDEPSIGLHQRDNDRLIKTLKTLRDLGNTIIVVEHDRDTILAADHVVDIGPGAGEHGGKIVATGTPVAIKNSKRSLTGEYLVGKKQIRLSEIKAEVQKVDKIIASYNKSSLGKTLKLIGAQHNNLKNITTELPLGKFVAITGVSGSGKSSLINETLVKYLRYYFYDSKDVPGKFTGIEGLEHIDKIIDIDQSPIGRTPRSNPATYTGMFTPIRELYASTTEARSRGYKMGRFSFNVHGGRCEACQGDGVIKIEMQFLPDVYVTCEICQGKRYNRETLQIDYKGKNIADVLGMTVETATEFFKNLPAIRPKLETLNQVGLGYIRLGQQATTLSGGEAQRIKLAAELSKRNTGKTLYVLDEPTTGLHFEDLRKLLIVLHSLVAKGNTVLVIEHNLDLIKTADWIIDLGPEGGERGGNIVAVGTPAQIAANSKSYTGQWLKSYL